MREIENAVRKGFASMPYTEYAKGMDEGYIPGTQPVYALKPSLGKGVNADECVTTRVSERGTTSPLSS